MQCLERVDLNSFGTHCRCVNKNRTDNLIRPFINIIAWHLEKNACIVRSISCCAYLLQWIIDLVITNKLQFNCTSFSTILMTRAIYGKQYMESNLWKAINCFPQIF